VAEKADYLGFTGNSSPFAPSYAACKLQTAIKPAIVAFRALSPEVRTGKPEPQDSFGRIEDLERLVSASTRVLSMAGAPAAYLSHGGTRSRITHHAERRVPIV